MKYMFSPSLMCADLLDIKNQIEILNERADFFHIDIMDGHYVKNITLSPMFIEQVKKITRIPLDIHLMTERPNDFIEAVASAGADIISPHADTIDKDAFRTIKTIKDCGCKAGVVLNPATPLEQVEHYLSRLDKITFLTVDAGYAGQEFIPEILDKIKKAKELKEKYGYKYLVEVDGSCNAKTFKVLAEAGTEVFIVGSSGLFNLDPDLKSAWNKMISIFIEKVEQ